jgi:hypothetical protein
MYLLPYLTLLPFITPVIGFFVFVHFSHDPIGAVLTYLVAGWWVVGLVTFAICRVVADIIRSGSLNAWLASNYLSLVPFITPVIGFFIFTHFYHDPSSAVLMYLLVGWWVVGLVTFAVCRVVSDIIRLGSLNAWLASNDYPP